MRITGAICLAAALVLLPGSAVGENESRIDTLSMGTYWYGAKLEKKDLEGKVVLLEIWGS